MNWEKNDNNTNWYLKYTLDSPHKSVIPKKELIKETHSNDEFVGICADIKFYFCRVNYKTGSKWCGPGKEAGGFSHPVNII